jgi:TonB family protein
LAVPFISITVDLQTAPNLRSVIPVNEYFTPELRTVNNNLPNAPGSIQAYSDKKPMAVNTSAILLTIYVLGVIFFLIRFLRNIRFLSQRTKSSEKITFKGYRIVLIPALINPCCFLKSIYLNKTDYLNSKIDQALIDHEIEHAKQYHTIDIILIELVKIFYWFNPVHVLYDRAIRINHEFLADNEVLRDKSDIKDYAENLLSFIAGKINISLTSASNHSFTKKRLMMMMKSGSGRLIYGTRIAAALCFGAVFFISLSFKEADNKLSENNLSGTGTEITQNVIRGIVTTNDGIPLSGVTIKTNLNNNQSVETISDFDGRFNVDDVQSGSSLLIEYRGFKTQTIKADFSSEMVIKLVRDPNFKGDIFTNVVQIVNFRHPDFSPANALVVIDGRILDNKDNLKVNPDEMRSFKALKDKDALKRYGEKGKDGVIEITMYGNKTRSDMASDSSKYRTSISMNKASNKGELIDIPVSNLQYVQVWTDHYLNKTNKKESRYISIMTRDYFKVKGTVITEKNKPLLGVKITATDNSTVETSDKNGRFLINDVREGAILDFSMPEYKTYHLSTLYEVAFNIDLTVQLEKDGKENNDILEKAEKMPQYPGGDMELLKFIAMNTQYPETAKTEKAQGKVIVKFIVDTEGKVKDATIFKGVHPALDAEALRVVGNLERFIPGTDGGKPVSVYYYLPITFSLPISNTQK